MMNWCKKFSRLSKLCLSVVLTALCFACAATPDNGTPLSKAPNGSQQTVAILPFENNSIGNAPETRGLSLTLPESISTQLMGAPDIKLLDRESIEKVLAELSLSSGALSAQAGRLKLGEVLGVHTLIVGEYSAFMGGLRLDARIVEVQSGTILGAKSLEGQVQDRDEMEKELSKTIAALLFEKLGFSTRPAFHAPITARDFFRKGYVSEQENKLEEALLYYQKALVLQPEHLEARERMENLLLLMID